MELCTGCTAIGLYREAHEQIYPAYRIEANCGKHAETFHNSKILRRNRTLADCANHHHEERDSSPDPNPPNTILFEPGNDQAYERND